MPNIKKCLQLCLALALCASHGGTALAAEAEKAPRPGTFAIGNVRVFDGKTLGGLQTVVIENGLVASVTAAGATPNVEMIVDGQGGTLMPGLIDSHIHLHSQKDLEQAAQWGVTTMLDMGTKSALTDSLRHLARLPDIRGSGTSAAPANGMHVLALGCSPLTSPEDAEAFVAARAAEGADYIKVIIDSPTQSGIVVLDEANLNALTRAAHKRHLRVNAHITLPASAAMAARSGVDVITHIPLNKPITPELAAEISERKMIAVPTLVMLKGIVSKIPANANPQGFDYHNTEISVQNLLKAGVPVVAGTDSNNAPGAPFNVPHGESLHEELALLVKAGLTPVEALRSATSLPAELFNLTDRGVIEAGRWADLVLVNGDPTTDINATRNIRAVWIAGVQAR